MVMYQCEICSFSTKDKSKFSRHCNRKFTCVPQNDLLENQSDDGCSKNGRNRRNFKSISGIYGRCSAEKSPQKGLLGISSENDELKKKSIPENISIQNFEKDKIFKKKTETEKSENPDTSTKKTYECSMCGKIFSQNGHMHRHERKCIMKLDLAIANKINKSINNKMDEFQNNIADKVTFNQSITNNNTINITINAYGKEDLSFLPSSRLFELLHGLNISIIPKLIKDIHCNPKHPENMNLFKPNKKDEYLMVYNGERWKLDQSKKVIDQLIFDKLYFIDNRIEEIPHNIQGDLSIKSNLGDKLSKVQDALDDDDEKRKVGEQIVVDLYNNKDYIDCKLIQ
jgi:hypothetical protein